ncbi:MAG: hypothetical protein AB7O62_15200 [Pirellulales bacterium]
MNKPEIVINVHGGMVQEVFCSEELADLVIVDWDVTGDSAPGDGVVVATQGRTRHAAVVRPIVYPLWQLAGTEVEAAIEASDQLQGAEP